jgi:hypothetical protein
VSKISTSRAKSASDARQPVDLVDDHNVDPAGPDIGEQALQRRPEEPAAAPRVSR